MYIKKVNLMDKTQIEYDIMETEVSMKKATGFEKQQLAEKLISLNNRLVAVSTPAQAQPSAKRIMDKISKTVHKHV